MTPDRGALVATYDAVAVEYGERLSSELDAKPFDRLMLDQFAEKVGDGPVADLGCGPGHVARYLYERGVSGIFGVDLSPEMVRVARERNPDPRFEVGDMTALDHPDGRMDGVVSFYSLVHLPTHKLAGPLLEWARVTRIGGWLVLAFHQGADPTTGRNHRHLDEWWGHAVDVDFFFHPRGAVGALLRQTGWRVVDSMERPPYAPEVEYPSRRGYMLARRVERPK